MIRRCDGNDEYLIKPKLVVFAEGPLAPAATTFESCDCGLTFDDVERMVVWPHKRIPPRPKVRRA